MIVGAGPYGLATAAHLRARGEDPRVFGHVMGAWERMPQGMLLRSFRESTSIGDPHARLTIDAFERNRGRPIPTPVPIRDFVEYGRWFHSESGVDADPRLVRTIADMPGGFRVVLEDGSELTSANVVVGAGIAPFTHVPPELAGVDHGRISHSSVHEDVTRFRGLRVLVVGAGQSGLELGALAHEVGAVVEVISRRPLRFLRGERVHHHAGIFRGFLYPSWGVGPPGLNWLMGRPEAFARLPSGQAQKLAARAIRPAGAAWLRPRLEPVRVTIGACVRQLREGTDELEVILDDGSERRVDHLIAATGYRVDIARYPFLAPSLVERIERVEGFPSLTGTYESSVRGLYFVGAPAARSMGPGMRFVSHSGMAAAAVARGIARTSHS